MEVKRNSFYGLVAFVIPTVVMLIAYPILVHRLGEAQVGIYLLATSFSGTMTILDFGLSFATVKFVAEDMAKGDHQATAETIVTSLLFYGGLGVLGALLIWFLSPWLIPIFSIEPALRTDAVWVFRLAAIQFLALFLITVFVSLFKGMQRFERSTLTLSSLSILTYGGAIAGVVLAGVGVVGLTAISAAANLVVLFVAAAMGLALCRSHGIVLGAARPSLSTLRRLFGFGIAMTVHALGAVLFPQVQRLLVGALIGPAAVTIYVVAVTAVSKVHALIAAATEVVFPLSSAVADQTRLRRIYLRMLVGSGVIAILILSPLAVFAEPILTIWIDAGFALNAAPVMQIMAVGYFFVALSPAPFHLVNGIGRPWFNVIFDMVNIVIAASALTVFALTGITLVKFAWAIAIAYAATGLLFQTSVETVIWRWGLLISNKLSISETTR